MAETPSTERWTGAVICAWCKRQLRAALDPSVVHVSHGICNPPCPEAVRDGWTQELLGPPPTKESAA